MNVLVLNPGSTSTKVALFAQQRQLFDRQVSHDSRELSRLQTVSDQLDFRKQVILAEIRRRPEFLPAELAAVVGRGGLLHPLAGGVYRVNAAMKEDLAAGRYGSHASNLGALLADLLAQQFRVPAFIADPVVVDELSPLARYSGLPEIPRRSIFHALNQRATAKKAAAKLGRAYQDCHLIVAHMGGGTSVGLHEKGRVTDVNNALDGDGPFSMERAGRLPPGDWLRYIMAHDEDPGELQRKLTGNGGVVAYLGSSDARRIEEAIEASLAGSPGSGALDGPRCAEIMDAMCYQVAKEICALAAVVSGQVDAVVLTGGLAHSARVVGEITRRVSFLAPVLVFPGENEMEALAAAAFSALEGRETVQEYRRV